MMTSVFHGATSVVKRPLCAIGRNNLDFGKGFYVTAIRKQAESWAMREVNIGLPQWINLYELNKDEVYSQYQCLRFEAYDQDWLEFIANSRTGNPVWKQYDFIEGGVADDRVIDTVQLYMLGLMEVGTALKRLAQYQPNNQMCILSQSIIDNCLYFTEAIPLNEIARKQQKETKYE